MCCRYELSASPRLHPYVEAAKRAPLTAKLEAQLHRPLRTEGEIRPTDLVPVLAPSRTGRAAVFPMVWGLTGRKSPLFNARAETAGSKPTFRESWASRRCVVPASWYDEWEHAETPDGKKRRGVQYRIQAAGEPLTYLAGLYRLTERDGPTVPEFVILTREAAEDLRRIHDRMPVILPESAISRWLDPAAKPEEMLCLALTELRVERAEGEGI